MKSAVAAVLGAPSGYTGNNGAVSPEHEAQMKVESTGGTRSPSPDAKRIVQWGAAIVIGAVVLLWILGAVVFKDANL